MHIFWDPRCTVRRDDLMKALIEIIPCLGFIVWFYI